MIPYLCEVDAGSDVGVDLIERVSPGATSILNPVTFVTHGELVPPLIDAVLEASGLPFFIIVKSHISADVPGSLAT